MATQYFGNSLSTYMISLVVLVMFIIVGKSLYFVSKKYLRRLASKSKSELDDLILDVLEKPVVFVFFLVGFQISYRLLNLTESAKNVFENISSILFIIGVSWVVIRFIDALITHYLAPAVAHSESDMDDLLLPLIKRLAKVIIIVIATIMIISEVGYDITSLIAGLGVGGLAFALAAKDMLSNLFGGVFILTDKPFKIGDRVRMLGFDGKVKEIGLRSTLVKTLDGTELIVPNAKIADSVLENVSREQARKVKLELGLTYETSANELEKAIQIIRQIIESDQDTDKDCLVYFTKFGDFALGILVIYWIKNLDNILPAQHAINMEIKRRFDAEGLDFAYPTQMVYHKNK